MLRPQLTFYTYNNTTHVLIYLYMYKSISQIIPRPNPCGLSSRPQKYGYSWQNPELHTLPPFCKYHQKISKCVTKKGNNVAWVRFCLTITDRQLAETCSSRFLMASLLTQHYVKLHINLWNPQVIYMSSTWHAPEQQKLQSEIHEQIVYTHCNGAWHRKITQLTWLWGYMLLVNEQ